MPRAEAGSAKAVANRMKLNGLQRLRWYCQMCEKQCRDENGFKCHTMSEAHLRQMRIFAENPNKMLNEFSRDFEKGYLKVLSHRHGSSKVSANKIYQEYIADKEHVHMNATAWSSLSGFCQYLGREGKCLVEETEKGLFIQYIDQDPKALERKANMEARQIGELNEEERQKRMIEAQIAAAANKRKDINEETQNEGDNSSNFLHRDEGSKIALDIGLNSMATKKRPRLNFAASVPDNDSHEEEIPVTKSIDVHPVNLPSTRPVVTEVKEKSVKIEMEDKIYRNDHWLYPNLIVKVLNDKVCEGKYYKDKGVILRVIDTYIGEVRMSDGAILRIDQEQLQTVLPKVGEALLLVNGRCIGCRARLVAIHKDDYNCDVVVEDGKYAKKELKGIEYEDVCAFDM